MKNREDIVYSICVEDLQNVATEHLSRKLTDKEIHLVESKLGEWSDAITNTIDYCLPTRARRRSSIGHR
jgi:hypothetical protein